MKILLRIRVFLGQRINLVLKSLKFEHLVFVDILYTVLQINKSTYCLLGRLNKIKKLHKTKNVHNPRNFTSATKEISQNYRHRSFARR